MHVLTKLSSQRCVRSPPLTSQGTELLTILKSTPYLLGKGRHDYTGLKLDLRILSFYRVIPESWGGVANFLKNEDYNFSKICNSYQKILFFIKKSILLYCL